MHKVAIELFDGTVESLRQALVLSDAFQGLDPRWKILIKPNLVWGGMKGYPPFGVVTSGILIDHLLLLLREHGCRDVSIGEGTVFNKELGSSTERGFQWSGISRDARKHGVRLIDFNDGPFNEISIGGIRVHVARAVLDADLVINVPVLKTHCQAKVTLGLKNLKGCLKITSKRIFHKKNLHELIARLNTVIRPGITLIDGIYALERGPDMSGTAHRRNLILASRDALSCDMTGASVLGIDPEEVDHLRIFASLTGRPLSMDDVEVVGVPLSQAVFPLLWKYDHEAPFVSSNITGLTIQDPGDTFCSGCMILLTAFSAVFCKDHSGTALQGVEICGGKEVRPRSDSSQVFLLGQCAISANQRLSDAVRIKGCPPSILNAVLKMSVKMLPPRKAAASLALRSLKNVGMKLGVYHESFPLFGNYSPPEFDLSHYGG